MIEPLNEAFIAADNYTMACVVSRMHKKINEIIDVVNGDAKAEPEPKPKYLLPDYVYDLLKDVYKWAALGGCMNTDVFRRVNFEVAREQKARDNSSPTKTSLGCDKCDGIIIRHDLIMKAYVYCPHCGRKL